MYKKSIFQTVFLS